MNKVGLIKKTSDKEEQEFWGVEQKVQFMQKGEVQKGKQSVYYSKIEGK